MSIELRVRWHLFPLMPVAFLTYLMFMLFNLQMMKHWIDSNHIILCLVVEPQFPSFRFTSFPTFPPIWIRDKDLDGIVRILCPSLAIGLKRTEELCEFHNFFCVFLDKSLSENQRFSLSDLLSKCEYIQDLISLAGMATNKSEVLTIVHIYPRAIDHKTILA